MQTQVSKEAYPDCEESSGPVLLVTNFFFLKKIDTAWDAYVPAFTFAT